MTTRLILLISIKTPFEKFWMTELNRALTKTEFEWSQTLSTTHHESLEFIEICVTIWNFSYRRCLPTCTRRYIMPSSDFLMPTLPVSDPIENQISRNENYLVHSIGNSTKYLEQQIHHVVFIFVSCASCRRR